LFEKIKQFEMGQILFILNDPKNVKSMDIDVISALYHNTIQLMIPKDRIGVF